MGRIRQIEKRLSDIEEVLGIDEGTKSPIPAIIEDLYGLVTDLRLEGYLHGKALRQAAEL